MRSPPRTPPNAPSAETARRPEARLTIEELAIATGISRARVARLIRLGLVEPAWPGTSEFAAATAAQLRRMLRLHADLGVNLIGAAIIVDLLERLERLEAELARVRGGR
jgi:chaperone modulatory protein CbpM